MEKQILFEAEEVQRIISRMAHEILEKNGGVADLVLLGIRSRGAHLVRRIGKRIEAFSGGAPSVEIVDVAPYRDDVTPRAAAAGSTSSASVDEKTVVLVDDVIYTGRTIRAALDLVGRVGKPRKILVAILIDRGQRELPIKADIVGKNVEVRESERVNVLLEESDGIDQVTVTSMQPALRVPTKGG
jgi:pyrimidine operon attenuation protein/uracil phosphoribosyltransferase